MKARDMRFVIGKTGINKTAEYFRLNGWEVDNVSKKRLPTEEISENTRKIHNDKDIDYMRFKPNLICYHNETHKLVHVGISSTTRAESVAQIEIKKFDMLKRLSAEGIRTIMVYVTFKKKDGSLISPAFHAEYIDKLEPDVVIAMKKSHFKKHSGGSGTPFVRIHLNKFRKLVTIINELEKGRMIQQRKIKGQKIRALFSIITDKIRYQDYVKYNTKSDSIIISHIWSEVK